MTTTNAHITLVDDDEALTELLGSFLEGDSFQVSRFESGDRFLAEFNPAQTDAVVLDIMMPGLSGLEVLQTLRSRCDVPVIMLTGRGDDIDRIVGLEMGADDYLAKPCNPRELSARLRAILRRLRHSTPVPAPRKMVINDVTLDMASRKVSIDGEPLAFTSAEFNTLSLLMQHAGDTLSKEFLTEQVLQRKLTQYDRSIDVHVSRIRQKLGKYKEGPIITAIRGVGYQFVLPD